ncbi:MAG TPA: tRNA (adenosine(37)-N6)-threonylcarbamoyltransferase complex dimerization subunit type 1 TsaB [Oceanospirillaceae bacterium]|nr:tRNA (adenosine(37)-N6)-threonylcarbamoyltransferase complex dimerization subunit type 1 TsaB [Oceanospirillaceae bacterium]
MPNLLALDTSGTACSVAVLCQQTGQVDQVFALHEAAERSHTQRLLPMIEEVLAMAGIHQRQLHAIIYGRGPGSFTGIRIAAGVAQGLSFGLDIPLVPVSTLAAMALQASEQYPNSAYLCSLDARMNEVYVGAYRVDELAADLTQVLSPEQVIAPDLVLPPNLDVHAETAYVVCGSGLDVANFPVQIIERARACVPTMEPKAEHMLALGVAQLKQGKGCLPEQALPVYLRDEVTWQKLPRYQ